MGIYKFIFSKEFLKQIALAAIVFVALILIVLLLLGIYTRHGEAIEVPDVKDIELSEAIPILEGRNLSYQIIDSVYMPNKKRETILEQTPPPYEKIKKGRKLYVVTSTNKAPLVQLPDVSDISFRNAKSTLETMGFPVTDVEYIPSEYKNLVSDVKVNGVSLSPGAKLPQGTPLTLVVGTGALSEDEIPMPSFRGLSKEMAIRQAHVENLSVRTINFDVPPDSPEDEAKYVVYKQNPITFTPIRIGGKFDIWLTKNTSLLDLTEEIFGDDNSSNNIEENFF